MLSARPTECLNYTLKLAALKKLNNGSQEFEILETGTSDNGILDQVVPVLLFRVL
jgi:hypothetical protein